LHWPTFRPPAVWVTADRYDHAVDRLVATGAAADPGSVYLLARLSARYPTVEVRVADAALCVEDAVLLAAVVRALVATLVDDALRGRPIAPARQTDLRAALLAAARNGGATVDHRDDWSQRQAAERCLERLLRRIRPALEQSGDFDEVVEGIARLGRHGTGADRQRSMWAAAIDPTAFVASLADAAIAVPAG
jgi:carboxylate-amine ligase